QRLSDQLQQDERERQHVADLDRIRLESSDPVPGAGYIDIGRAAPKLAGVFQAAGYEVTKENTAVTAQRIRSSRIRIPRVAARDFGALVDRDRAARARVLEVARRADPDAWRDRLRQPDIWDDAGKLKGLARAADCKAQSPHLLTLLAQRL